MRLSCWRNSTFRTRWSVSSDSVLQDRTPCEGTMPVRFSTRCPNSDYLGFEASPEAIVAAAKKAEEVGFDAIFVNDNIIVDGSPCAAPWTNVYDPFDVVHRRAHHPHRCRGFGAYYAVSQPGCDRQELGDDRPDVWRSADRRCWRRLERA